MSKKLDFKAIEKKYRHLPHSFGDVSLLEGVTKSHYHGFVSTASIEEGYISDAAKKILEKWRKLEDKLSDEYWDGHYPRENDEDYEEYVNAKRVVLATMEKDVVKHFNSSSIRKFHERAVNKSEDELAKMEYENPKTQQKKSAAARKKAFKPKGPASSRSGGRKKTKKSTPKVLKTDLLRQATAKKIVGRHCMSKQQLINALK